MKDKVLTKKVKQIERMETKIREQDLKIKKIKNNIKTDDKELHHIYLG